MKTTERRNYTVKEFRVEKRDQGPNVIIGHAAVFDSPSEDLGGFREKIERGAFADAIREDDIRALFNHDPNYVLGRNRSGTLRLKEDDHGLAIEIDMPDTQFARDLIVSMSRGDINQMSFGFRVEDQVWEEKEDKSVMRTLRKVSLFDVSPVTYPAYPQTDVAVRSMDEWRGDLKKEKSEADAWKIQQMQLRQQYIEADIL